MTDRLPPIAPTTVVVRSEHQVSTDLSGEAVILDLDAGNYFTLNEIGARLWALLEAPTSVAALRTLLVRQYDVEPDQAEEDVVAFVQDLRTAGLIRVQSG